ncbi:MAG: ATP-binding cassette domain-containing protein [Thermoplasmata archaeon]
MIDTEGLTKRFGSVTAVSDLSLHVADGEVFGFLGPNGAGKTTTVRMLTCLISTTSGSATIGGRTVGPGRDGMAIRRMIGLVPENVGLYESLSAYRNLDFFGKLYDFPEAERHANIERYLKMMDLWDRRDEPVGNYSKGMKQKIAIARALIHDPKVLFLDEPTANLDPEAAKTVRDFILDLRKGGKTIFLNTHNLDEAQRICDRIAILKTRLITVGTPSDLEKGMAGRRTVIELDHATDAIVSAVEGRIGRPVTRDGNTISITAVDPERENPGIIEAIVGAGGHIRFVTEVRPTLEDVYLRSVREAR